MSALLVACSCSSYSEIINGITPNSIGIGLNWDMSSILPNEGGLIVNGVFYRYTTVKKPEDEMLVNIRNKNALGDGYIFDRQDNWSGLPGNTITKSIPVENIPREAWGDGEIAVTGNGSVKDAQVAYSYRFDTCYDPLNDPACPGYADAMARRIAELGLWNQAVEIKDPLDDQNVRDVIDRKAELEDEEKEKNKKKSEDQDRRKKVAKGAADSAVGNALAVSQEALLAAMADVPNFNSYYTTIPGGVYADAIGYALTVVPENKSALRVGLAQQLLHNKMVDEQYKPSE